MSDRYAVVTPSPIRKVIAARMTESVTTVPHFRAVAEIEVDRLLAARARLKEMRPAAAVSLNDLIVKACGHALIAVPEVNSQWVDGRILRFHSADIAVAIALADGLVMPVVRDVQAKPVWSIAREIRDFAERAARRALQMEELQGGSFAVSNLGMFGVEQFDAIISPPQCAILAVGAARRRCLADDDGRMRVASTIRVTLSADHRAIDGATSARFLAQLRRHMEDPASLLPEENEP
jgi:pyruvate dehydrogenase E2 component (dihydrolipoamide acetyltransferase)